MNELEVNPKRALEEPSRVIVVEDRHACPTEYLTVIQLVVHPVHGHPHLGCAVVQLPKRRRQSSVSGNLAVVNVDEAQGRDREGLPLQHTILDRNADVGSEAGQRVSARGTVCIRDLDDGEAELLPERSERPTVPAGFTGPSEARGDVEGKAPNHVTDATVPAPGRESAETAPPPGRFRVNIDHGADEDDLRWAGPGEVVGDPRHRPLGQGRQQHHADRFSLSHPLHRPEASTTIAAMSLRAEVIATTAGVEGVAPSWESLRSKLEGTPFLGSVFYLGWLEKLGSGFDPLLVRVVDDEGEVVAIAPWARRGPLAISVSGRGGVAGELLVADRDGAEAWRLILAAVLRRGGPRAVVVPHATGGPRGLDGARSAASSLGLPMSAQARFVRHRLQLRGTTFEEHLTTWSGKRRYSVRRSQRRLEARGAISLHRLSGVDGYDTVRMLHVRQWTADQTIHQIHTEAGVALDQLLIAEIPSETLVLESRGVPLAAALWLDAGHLRVLQYLVRDPDETETSPGELVHFHVVRLAFEDDVRELDTMGAGGNKEHLGIPGEPAYELRIGRGAIGRLMLGIRAAQLKARSGLVMPWRSGRRRARAGRG